MKRAFALAALVVLLLPVMLLAKDSNDSRDSLAQFEGGIGVDPAALVNGVFVPNTVRGVAPGGRPWVIADLKADVKVGGRIKAEGRGLILGGGDSIGTPDGVTSVKASLFCGAAGSADANVAHSSGPTPIDQNGDFRIDDVLTPAPPDPCTTPVLLIRNGAAGPGNWFAAGIPKRHDD